MDNSRSRSPKRKHRSRKSHSHSRSRRDGHRRSASKEDKHKHKKSERVYESPFILADIQFSSALAGPVLSKIIKKDYPKMIDVDDIRLPKKKPLPIDTTQVFLAPPAEEICKQILNNLIAS
jgi:hypothetical protein